MTKAAYICPGQGAQYPGMGAEFYRQYPLVREYFERADAALGYPLSTLCFHGPKEELTLTQHAQPAILSLSCAIAALVEIETGVLPAVVSGLSLGEYSALVIAGMLEFEDAVRLVARRGIYMQKAVPPGEGGMAAIFGLMAENLEELCKNIGGVQLANYNCPGQVVVSGATDAVTALVDAALAAGARRAIHLEVSAPFHCSMLQPAAEMLQTDLEKVSFTPPRFPVLSPVDLSQVNPDSVRQLLARQVVSPVRWQQCIEILADQGVQLVIETGPGKVLTGLVRKTAKNLKAIGIEQPVELDQLKEELQC